MGVRGWQTLILKNHLDHHSEENFHCFGLLHKMQEDIPSRKQCRKTVMRKGWDICRRSTSDETLKLTTCDDFEGSIY